mmetsp:Transcript_52475/g.94055  ORF Transcript_52475/g.94055 Transcript_52475/m.94055 type:complete len:546 (-) Transcript_52475:88-1725(-)
MDADWQNINSTDVAQWLESKGLGSFSQKIIDASDAESVDDFKLFDEAMVEEVVAAAELKVVSAKKFRLAIAELHGETDAAASPTAYQLSLEPRVAPAIALPVEVPAVPAQAVCLEECVAICIDRSGSMGSPFAEITLNVVKGETKNSVSQRTRMEAVKAMFYAFRDRVESAGLKGSHQLGLFQFDNSIERMLDLTPKLDQFEAIVDDIMPGGQTAIYSSILAAARMLEQQFQVDSGVDLRILVLTDGQNNTGIAPESALEAVNKIGAVVDAIIVGDRPDSNLRKIVNATGGDCYQISNLGEGFELLESEAVVSLKARRGGAEKPAFKEREAVNFSSILEKTLTSGSSVPRAQALASDFTSKAVVDVTAIDTSALQNLSTAATKRIMSEIKQVANSSAGEGVHIFPSPDTLNFWRALIEGPAGSPFEGGVFLLNVIIPDSYPFSAPQIVFETPVYHCNVSDSGKICLDLLQDRWNPSLTVPKALEAVRVMLSSPDTNDALRQWIAELTIAYQNSNGADTRYLDKAQESTSQHAALSVEDWKKKWKC